VDFKKKEATVTYDPSVTTPEELARVLGKETGFSVAVRPEKDGKPVKDQAPR
jgi:hypothetical protein